MVFILSLAVIAALIVAVLRPTRKQDFRLPVELARADIETEVRRLAARSRIARFGGCKPNVGLLETYCKRAQKVVSEKMRAGEPCDDYELRFAENYHIISAALAEVRAVAHEFSALPTADGSVALYAFVSFVVQSHRGTVGKEEWKAYFDLYNSVRPLTWSEICRCEPMIRYALLEQLTVYASKILKRNDLKTQAIRDIHTGKIDADNLKYNSYIRFLFAYGCEEFRDKLRSACAKFGIDADGAEATDAKISAGYSGGISAAVDGLRAEFFDTDFLLSLSVPACRLEEEKQLVFADLTARTKADYIGEIEREARRRHISELERTERIIALAKETGKDIAHYIIRPPRGMALLRLQQALVLGLSAVCAVLAALFLFPRWKIVFGVLSLPLLATVWNRLFLYVAGRLTRKRIVPELTTKDSPPTAIIRCVAVHSATNVKKIFQDIQTTAALNREPFFSYGLLIDCLNPGYTTICEDISRFYGEICGKGRFFVCLRKNSWERKRGAILQFNDFVTHGISDPFVGVWGNVRPFRYVVTLDADTELTGAARLVGMMEHPYQADKTVLSIETRAKIAGLKTAFSRLMCGERGLSHYDVSSSVVFDLYGFGNYTGKGIYRVKEFNDGLRDAFPDDRVLSHDLLEGAVVGCAASGVSALDDFPMTYASYTARLLRWMRGDLQLFPWLFRKVKNRRGKRVYNRVGSVAKWQMITNILGVLAPICALGILVSACVSRSYFPLIFAFLPQLVDFLLSFGLWRRPADMAREQVRQIFLAIQMPTLGLCAAFALVVTAWRMAVGRNLLQWKTYAAAGGNLSLFAGNAIVAVLFLTFGVLRASVVDSILAAVFLSVIPLDFVLSARKTGRKTKIDRDGFLHLARLTWGYFEETLTAKNRFLPCDNFQEHKGWANRTSPTNIGMAMSSAVCAAEIGLISENRRDELLGKILQSLRALESYRGLPYNWYAVDDLHPLSPKYVSAVDCGNLMAALLLVSSLGGENGDAARSYLDGMEMAALFDSERGLLRIGLNVDSMTPDGGHYDLLGSEAALTYLLCVSCGKIPLSSYARLSRRAFKSEGKRVLASWTGGMFEYLLPLMFFEPSPLSLVGMSAKHAAIVHRRVARKAHSDVFGMSESLYGAVNDSLDYKYKAFGVFSVALTNDRCGNVFAPYAAVMAGDVLRENNGLKALTEKYCGAFGLYDSVDLDAKSVQKSNMSHHQGMILLAVTDLLCGRFVKECLATTAEGRAAQVLLDESPQALRGAEKKTARTVKRKKTELFWETSRRSVYPQLNYLSNGTYRLVIDECGHNYQMCDGVLLSRFDRMSGLRVFLSCEGISVEPTADARCRCTPQESEYATQFGEVDVRVRAGVEFDANAEYRKIILKNRGKTTKVMSVIVADKPCLTAREADLAHKAFSSMFVETGYDEANNFVFARRTDVESKKVSALFADAPSEFSGDERSFRAGKTGVFGRTTEPLLGLKTEVTLRSGETKSVWIYLAYGLPREVRAMRRMLPFGNERAVSMSVYSANCAMSATVRTLGARLLFADGRRNGALPCVTMSVNRSNLDLCLSLLGQLRTLHSYGIDFTVILFYKEPVSYFMELSEKIEEAVSLLGVPCRTVNELLVGEEETEALKTGGIDLLSVRNRALPPYYVLPAIERPSAPFVRAEIETKLGSGGFTAEGDFVRFLPTPSPWCNVLSDGKVGCVVSDRGGFTFGGNSRQEKLTRHTNDELCADEGDGIVLGEGGLLWSLSAVLRASEDGEMRHSPGISTFTCGRNGLFAKQTVFVYDGVKYYDVVLRNPTETTRQIDVMCYAEVVLGDHIAQTSGGIVCGEYGNVLYAENGECKLFLSCDLPPASTAFFAESYRDRSGRIRVCAHLENAGCTPALAYSVAVPLAPHGSRRLIFTLSPHTARVNAETADRALACVKKKFERFPVICDELPMKYYLRWLPYQTLVARFTARCGFQQVGGAIGFRDQLQDAVALLGICPNEVRRHLLDAAAHQFEQGDVLHWWHEPAVGVRTRICDDRLFLPYAVCKYVEYTGDDSVWDEQVAYLKDQPLARGEHSKYAYMETSDVRGSLFEHVLRAVESVELSERGLVLMGGGDWNDGMDRVGIRGRGESVWCTMFLYYILGMLSETAGDRLPPSFTSLRHRLFAAAEKCFVGDRYVRAFTDNGSVLGAESSHECKIDLLVQSWAVLSGIATGERAKTVLTTAYGRLVDEKNGIVRLLDPPFAEIDVGYISDYPKGVRENGGQYTHAAVWYIWALYEAGMTDKANRLLEMILPCSHFTSYGGEETYLKEPYVIAGDVYDGALAGRGGWTWYTGAAGWLYRLITEKYYGITVRRGSVGIRPNLPSGKVVHRNVSMPNATFDLTIDSRGTGKWKTTVGHVGFDGTAIAAKALDGKSVVVRRQKPVD